MTLRSRIKYSLSKLFSMRKLKKQILFESFGGTQYSADPRAISEKMHELYPDFNQVWYIQKGSKKNNSSIIPSYIKVANNKLAFIWNLAQSASFVTTQPITESFYKRKGQFVVQTWHGDRGFKKVLYEADHDGNKRTTIYDDKYTDLCVAASDFGESVYRTAFRYGGEVLKVGMPRNDKLLFPPTDLSSYRKRLSIPEGVKVLLYAPTFRGHGGYKQNAIIDICGCLDVLEKNGERWVCLVRAHEYSKEIIHSQDDRIIDVTYYPDMTDIMLVTDILITDYSSCACDFVITKKPVILAVNDMAQYEKESRRFKVNPEESGFVLSHSQGELENILRNKEKMDFSIVSKRVLDYFGTNEGGDASSAVSKRIHDAYYERSINENSAFGFH